MFKTILLTGVNGQVGHALASALENTFAISPNATKKLCPQKVVKLDRHALDLTDTDAIRRAVQSIKPDLIINPAAYTAVDKAETEPELAFAINATAPKILAEEAAKLGAKIIHFSTDYVYDGKKPSAYIEGDATNPFSIYGKSKLAGEAAILETGVQYLIFRTSWVYGAYGKNFFKTILRLASERESLSIVADQFGAPTSSTSIAQAILQLMQVWNEQAGIYHLVNAGETTWHGFATAIIEKYQHLALSPALKTTIHNILPITTQAFPALAMRPTNSRLSCEKLGHDFSVEIGVWQKALSMELQALG